MEQLAKILDTLWPPREPGYRGASNSFGVSAAKSANILSAFTTESTLVRLAGISGALAISIGAYGAHALRERGHVDERRLRAFDAGNRYHLLHSVALLSASKARYPLLTASLFLGGMIMFSGTCYHYSITGQENTRKYTPIGGIMYILAWISLII